MLNLKLFSDIEVKTQDKWVIVCTLLTPPLLNDIIDFFLYTRSYQEGLDFFSWVYSIMENTTNKDKDTEAFVHDTIILSRLIMLDKMNRWEQYVKEYDSFVPMQASTIKDSDRYHIIQKKLDMLSKGKNIEHMKSKQRYELSDEELHTRYEYLKRRIQKHLGGL